MHGLQKGDVIVTMFPFADGNFAKQRPAVVCAGPWRVSDRFEVCWVVMITTTILKGWPGDVDVPNNAGVGLSVPSIIRTLKIACIDTRNVIVKLDELDPKTLRVVDKHVRAHLA